MMCLTRKQNLWVVLPLAKSGNSSVECFSGQRSIALGAGQCLLTSATLVYEVPVGTLYCLTDWLSRH